MLKSGRLRPKELEVIFETQVEVNLGADTASHFGAPHTNALLVRAHSFFTKITVVSKQLQN